MINLNKNQLHGQYKIVANLNTVAYFCLLNFLSDNLTRDMALAVQLFH